MKFDFALLLSLLTALTGLIWLVDASYFAPRRARAAAARADSGAAGELAPDEAPAVVEYARSFFPILTFVLLFRSFVAEPFRIPSGSMIPTLLIGDFIVVNKWSYGLRMPVGNQKFLEIGQPQRGDVVVFTRPHDPALPPGSDPSAGETLVKRLVAVPGDRVLYDQHQLYVNGTAVPATPVGPYVGTASNGAATGSTLLNEQIGEVRHQILHQAQQNAPGTFGERQLGPNEYFMMGDNRDASSDSRAWGTVPDENLIGKVSYIWFHWDWNRAGLVEWKRLFTRVH